MTEGRSKRQELRKKLEQLRKLVRVPPSEFKALGLVADRDIDPAVVDRQICYIENLLKGRPVLFITAGPRWLAVMVNDLADIGKSHLLDQNNNSWLLPADLILRALVLKGYMITQLPAVGSVPRAVLRYNAERLVKKKAARQPRKRFRGKNAKKTAVRFR